MKKSVAIIINPISGTKDKKTIKQQIEGTLNRAVYDFRIFTTRYAGQGREIALTEREKGTDIVVAVGGDGTVNEIGCALAGSETALGIIPCGSGNGLSRHLHIPMRVKDAVEIINAGRKEKIDYGEINDHPFFCTCGIGFDASVTMEFAKKGSRGLLTYLETTLTEFLKYKPETYVLSTAEGGEIKLKAFLITVGNASQYGNNAYIAPAATLKDGLLDVMILTPFKPYDVPMLAYRLFHKKIEGSPYIVKLLTSHLTVHREKSGYAHFDGEPLKAGNDIDIKIRPHRLDVIVPSNIEMI